MFELFPLLAERRHQKAATLSGGERQLLAMARALMVSPKIIFLDEPSAGLSPLRADEVFGHVGRIAATGVAVVLIEQDVHRALAISRTRLCPGHRQDRLFWARRRDRER